MNSRLCGIGNRTVDADSVVNLLFVILQMDGVSSEHGRWKRTTQWSFPTLTLLPVFAPPPSLEKTGGSAQRGAGNRCLVSMRGRLLSG